jgi:hypothetical protein
MTSAGSLQSWWRNMTDSSNPAASWTQGITTPTKSSSLTATPYLNSTLATSSNDDQLLFQDSTGKLWSIGWLGNRETQQWGTPIDSGITAVKGSCVVAQEANSWKGEPEKAHIFTQLNGNDITHLLRTDNGTLIVVDELPI